MGQSEGAWFHSLNRNPDDQSVVPVCVRTVEYVAVKLQQTLAVERGCFKLENVFFPAQLGVEHFAMLA